MISRRAVILGLLGLLLLYLPGCGGGGGGSVDLSTSSAVWQEVSSGRYLITITVRNTGGKTANNVSVTFRWFRGGVLTASGRYLLGPVSAGQTRVFRDTFIAPTGATQINYELHFD
jgi:hypothetical protein